ncbi:PREDICTED: probable pectate lyase 4 [Camelina sativa]|uniref:Pectate lyase n=1 Tax=Camelina sativa TaxID=90675 RepID=A0ABM0YE31_CAMSA|nr:PREDICTED: probable pectate lyase 4 [Camelina sativa]
MDSIVITISLLFAIFASPLVESAYNRSNGYTLAKISLNPIDACWRRNPKWATSRQALAHCAVGYGKAALGGKNGPIYVVTDPSDDPVKPKPGTLRYAVVQPKPLWITFARDMVIVLKSELYVNSYKTIDGRGAKVEIGNGPCIRMKLVKHVIIHGISIHDCKPGPKEKLDGDGIRVFQSSHIWIDHCFLSRSQDGLIDVIFLSTAVTISNNYFTQHDKVMLLGHDDKFMGDKIMRVTIAFNYFGPGLIERMPRVRRGYAHVANNRYEKWQMYAIGGSADPIIYSEGNYFVAPDKRSSKQVTKRMTTAADSKKWKWSTTKDVFMNGAFFVPSGGAVKPLYKGGEAFPVAHGSLVPSLTSSAGPLRCYAGRIC